MSQSRRGSLVEASTNVVVGFVLSVVAGEVIFPLFGHPMPLSDNLGVTLSFTVLSLARGYVLRRVFNR